MTSRPILFGFIVLVVIFSPLERASGAEPDLWPSEVVTLMNQAMKFEPTAERRSISEPLIARMRTEGLSEIEQFFKAEAHFINLEPEPARDGYWKFRDRSDALGRVASQRLMIIRINAFEMTKEITESDIPGYRERFPIEPYDRYGISYPLSQTARVLIDNDQAEQGLDLIVEEVRLHDNFDSAYTAYQLPGQFLAAARENGRADEFIALHQWAVDGLSVSIENRLKAQASDLRQINAVPGEVFFSLFADKSFDHYRWTAEMMKLRDQLKSAASRD
ncbi:MAG TPA: hypothetical protein VJ984_07195 [Xanthomonadales bacterium]|nr:hypothetical protein [Xanthomonadales bacterium]